MLVEQWFPQPDPSALSAEAFEAASLRIWLLHLLVKVGVLLVGMFGILKNGQLFIDDASRLDL